MTYATIGSLQGAREVERLVNEIEGRLEQKVSSQRLFFQFEGRYSENPG